MVNFLAYVYFGALIVAMIAFGPSPLLYGLFALLAALFILPNHHLLGLSLIIVLTMVFERFFTLQGLVIDKNVYKLYLIDIVIGFSFLAWLVNHKINEGKKKIILGWPEKILLIWLALVAVYLIRSTFDLNADLAVSFSSFKNYFFYPLLYFFVIFSIDSGQKLKNIVHLMLLTASGLIIFLFIGLVNGAGLWTEFTPLSTVGTRYLAGTHAFYLALALIITVALLIYRRLRNEIFSLGIMGLWGLGIGLSLMRHLWLALFAGLATLFILLENKYKRALITYSAKTGTVVAAALMILICAASLLYFQGLGQKTLDSVQAVSLRLLSVTNLGEDTSVAWRQNLWLDAKGLWLNHPIIGIGFGHTVLTDNGDYSSFEEVRNMHNSPLAITVQMGLVGLAVFGLFIIAALSESFWSLKRNSDLEPYYLGLFAVMIVFLVASFFQPYLETNLLGIWLWLLLGLLRTASIIKDMNTDYRQPQKNKL